ncbi:aspartyl/asparaginyl beta-hydroxylase domain-containing protein [Sphingopyxis sp. PET50]|uniref:aspartyl/asparaginyl beta-hydroxylase domain-containing protein n=1 Tax=Sphingopyxis sp. PET50 TaxID=2976533 RepID=UPI0021AF21CE|nr:aspartyl/asparaginyl beta-hydroxylase domain-containing protein [Sphingopyxis sp. PET50]
MGEATLTVAEATKLAQEGGAALQRGDAEAARTALRPVADAGLANAQIWLMLGEAYRLTGDHAGQEEAADAVLDRDARALRAIVWKGDCRRAAGDRRAAASWYVNAIRLAEAMGPLPPSLQMLVAAAEAARAELDAEFGAALEAGLAERGLPPGVRSPAFARSIAIVRGDERVDMELQRPSSFYFPGLPQRAFYERDQFAWAPAVEAATAAIRAELTAALDDPGLFKPYLTHAPDRPRVDFDGMHDNPQWSALHLIENGAPIPEMTARFPETLAALDTAPLCRISVRSPSIMFSLLQPGARIAPHHGMINARLICHLPLVVPGAGALQVADEARQWEEGKLLIFDDSVQHEAWNDADSDRIVLIFDVWRPELSEADRRGVAALFETVDAYR